MISKNNFSKLEKKTYDTYKIAYLPSLAVVSLNQDEKNSLKSLVKIGDKVSEGQIIAESPENPTDEYYACIHSPIPGIVEKIENVTMPNGKVEKSVLIRMEGSFSFLGKEDFIDESTKLYSQEQLLKVISRQGVINTFDTPVSLASQIKKLSDKTTELTTPPLVVRLFDSEPDMKIESFLAQKFTREVIKGASYIAQAMMSPYVIFLCEKDKFNHPQDINYEDVFKYRKVEFVSLKLKYYPCGNYKILLKEANKILQSKYNESFKKILPVCSSTCLDVYNAIVKSMSSIDRYVQVQGDAIVQGNIFKVRVGTTFRNLFDECEGFLEIPSKIIVNGIVKGNSVADLDTPITRYVKSIFILTSRGFPQQIQTNCIRCGKCYAVCSEKIHPEKIYSRYINGQPLSSTLVNAISLCSECRLCNTFCPSRLPLYQTIKLLKDLKDEEKF